MCRFTPTTPVIMALQMVSAQTGNVFDSFTLTKPVGWKFNATAKAALVSGFIPTYQESLGQRYGYSGASAAATAILTVVYNNPQLFTGLANATLVQDINVMDTLANTLQVGSDLTPVNCRSPDYMSSSKTKMSYNYIKSCCETNVLQKSIIGRVTLL